MKRGLILILLFLLPTIGAYAQDDAPDEIPVITVHIGAQFGSATEPVNEIIQTLISSLEGRAEEIDGMVFQLEDIPEFSAITINVDLLADQPLLFMDIDAISPDVGLFPVPNIVPHPYTEFPLAIDPANPLWIEIMTELTLGVGAYLVGDCESALPYLDEVVALTEQQSDYYFLGQLEQTTAYTLFYKANCALIMGDYELASEHYLEVLQIFEANGFDSTLYGLDARINLAWVEVQNGNTEEAITILSEVEATQFEWIETDAILMRADIFAEVGDFATALTDLEDIQKSLNVEDPNLLLRTAFIRILAEDFEGADSDLAQLEKLAPELTDILYYRGLLAYFNFDDTSALEYFYTYLEADPEGVYAYVVEEYITEIEAGS